MPKSCSSQVDINEFTLKKIKRVGSFLQEIPRPSFGKWGVNHVLQVRLMWFLWPWTVNW
jgi:hypothetical protein